MLYLDSFGKAITSLKEAVALLKSGSVESGSMQEALMRDGIIQRFEYTFELSWKTIKRYLQEYGLEKIDSFTNKQLFRAAFEHGLVKNSEDWIGYLQRRNLTSHVYDEETAKKVYAAVDSFVVDVVFLFSALSKNSY